MDMVANLCHNVLNKMFSRNMMPREHRGRRPRLARQELGPKQGHGARVGAILQAAANHSWHSHDQRVWGELGTQHGIYQVASSYIYMSCVKVVV